MAATHFMLIAGEASGDLLAAELVQALKASPELRDREFPPKFFGAGGPRMAAAGVELALDLTQHSIIGLWEVVKKLWHFQRLMDDVVKLALQRQPDVIVCVDFSGFNRRFAQAVRQAARAQRGRFQNWDPLIVQFVSPQVWASRADRAWQMSQDFDLLLCLFPFEKAWYAQRVPNFRVECVGHPLLDRYPEIIAATNRVGDDVRSLTSPEKEDRDSSRRLLRASESNVLLLPGSRAGELRRHLPVINQAVEHMAAKQPLKCEMVLPSESLAEFARSRLTAAAAVEVRTGDLAGAMKRADVAITKSGTITHELACFGVPSVVFYKTSWPTYWIGRAVVNVEYLAMPNLLAGELVFPEFIQAAATGERIGAEALLLLNDAPRRQRVKEQLKQVVASLGGRGACQRAAKAILDLAAGK
jgi:lipid-A-disaccharide synthase